MRMMPNNVFVFISCLLPVVSLVYPGSAPLKESDHHHDKSKYQQEISKSSNGVTAHQALMPRGPARTSPEGIFSCSLDSHHNVNRRVANLRLLAGHRKITSLYPAISSHE